MDDEKDIAAEETSDGVAETFRPRSPGQRRALEIDHGADVLVPRVGRMNGHTRHVARAGRRARRARARA
jgi:hypothetical protein